MDIKDRHAFLIIAHNEFQILKILINLLDHAQNDIFVHFDRKVKDLPILNCQYSQIFIF